MKRILLAIALIVSIGTTMQAQLIKEKQPVDPRYLTGAVSVVDGMVTFTHDIDLPQSYTEAEAYQAVKHCLGKYFQREEVLRRKTLQRDSAQHLIEVGIVEYITFKDQLLVLDRSQMIYSLTIHCVDRKCHVMMTNISYYYEEERDPIKYTAEEWIIDSEALNKKKDGLSRQSGKFRVKTIDAFDAICRSIEETLR